MTLKTQMTTDLSVFFNTDDFAKTVTYTPAGESGANITAIFEPLSDGENMSADRTVKRGYLYIQSTDIEGPAYGDTVEIDAPETIEELGDEIMTNGDNEGAKATLDDDDDIYAASAQSNEQAKFGTYSTKITLSGATFRGYRQFYTNVLGDIISAGEVYRCTAWVYLPAGQAIDTIYAYSYGGGETAPVSTEITEATGTWVQGSVDITVEDQLDFRLFASDSQSVPNTNYFYIDEISIRRLVSKATRTWRVIEVPATDEEGIWKLLIEQDLRPTV